MKEKQSGRMGLEGWERLAPSKVLWRKPWDAIMHSEAFCRGKPPNTKAQ